MNTFYNRIALVFALLVLAGCAGPAKVNPMRTSIMVATAVTPGADGVTTTRAELCTFRKQISEEQVKVYEKDPSQLIRDDACRENGQLALHGSPSLGGELVKTGFGAGVGGVTNFFVQKELARAQGKICKDGGCIDTVNNNVNNNLNLAQGGAGGAGGVGVGGGGIAVSESNAGSAANVTVQSTGSGCATGTCGQ